MPIPLLLDLHRRCEHPSFTEGLIRSRTTDPEGKRDAGRVIDTGRDFKLFGRCGVTLGLFIIVVDAFLENRLPGMMASGPAPVVRRATVAIWSMMPSRAPAVATIVFARLPPMLLRSGMRFTVAPPAVLGFAGLLALPSAPLPAVVRFCGPIRPVVAAIAKMLAVPVPAAARAFPCGPGISRK